MTDPVMTTQLPLWPEGALPAETLENKPNLHQYWLHPETIPPFIATFPALARCLDLLGPLDWGHVPERNLRREWGQPTVSHTALLIAELWRLEERKQSFGELYTLLVENPGFIALCGFPRAEALQPPFSFKPRACLPTHRHLTRLLRRLPNAVAHWLFRDSVRLILAELAQRHVPPPDCVSLDTKHILAWVQENNPKAYVGSRYVKTRQPKGDPDCKLGCKRRHNQGPPPTTPTRLPRPATGKAVGEFYWGYGSGIVVAKVAELGEFVIAECTQTFDHADASYFFPLMHQMEQHLGYRPRFGTFDAAFDAWYVYAYFYRDSDPTHGMAAVPFSEKGGYKVHDRRFTADGLPLCKAGLPMPLKFTYWDRTVNTVAHERGRYVCPLRFPTRSTRACPINHPQWRKGGCIAMMPTSIGARLRYTLDRQSALYHDLYKQRSATERINSQAVRLGIERPHLRNGAAIANDNTLIYTLINLHFLQRLRQNHPLPTAEAPEG